VTDIMGEISAASNEQAAGVSQVGEAVTQMDQATQQNAALVEQMAAAASSLKTQAGEMVYTVAVFKVAGNGGMLKTNVRSPAAVSTSFKGEERRTVTLHTAKARPSSVPIMTKTIAAPRKVATKAASAPAGNAGADDWETF
jgi:3-deoxy-D-arabino-heptulosonate 7-phosphate (DAHP) synthase